MNRETMLQIAKECGLQVIFDNKLGREEYQSVFSSEPALERFANRMMAEALREAAEFFDPLGKGEVWPEDELRRMAEQLEKGK